MKHYTKAVVLKQNCKNFKILRLLEVFVFANSKQNLAIPCHIFALSKMPDFLRHYMLIDFFILYFQVDTFSRSCEKALTDRQTYEQQSDHLRVPFFLLRYGITEP